ncbi:MAG: ABC transporter ATP-binding protein [Euzebyales bacterium]|nr:ABC transporter ATP-binding protein [Euzebyales bacterium]
MTAAAIEISGLRMRYGPKVAVDDLDLEIASGSLVAVLGPNGAGKTTIVETVAGLRTPGAGTVRVHGLDPVADRDALRAHVAVQPQEAALIPNLRVSEALELWRALYPDGQDAGELVGVLGLEDSLDSVIDKLSGGQGRRLIIALTLMSDRPLMLLDEPASGLDPLARVQLWDAVRARHAAGRTVVVTTHLIEEAEALAERVIVIDHGRVVADGTAAELCARTGTDRLGDAYIALVSSPTIPDVAPRSATTLTKDFT